MTLKDPIAVYNATSNVEAIQVRDFLIEVGIEAFAFEDNSQIGTFAGIIGDNQSPQVWVERGQEEKAATMLAALDAAIQKRAREADDSGPILVTCSECGKTSEFPGSMRGMVELCPHCGATVDVGEPEDWGDVGEPEEEDVEE